MKVGFMGLPENIVYVRPLGGVHKRAPGELLATASGEKNKTNNNPKAFNKVELSPQLCERRSSLSKIFMKAASASYESPPFR